MKMKNFVLGSFLVASSAVFAAPVVSDISCQQGSGNWINITYALSEPAVVTINIETNRGDGVWVSIPAAAKAALEESANRLVDTAGIHTAKWRPYKAASWPRKREDFRFTVKAWATNMPPPYMVLNLLKPPGNVHYYSDADQIPGGVASVASKTEQIIFRRIDAAGVEWVMGEPDNASGAHVDNIGDRQAGRLYPAMPVVLTNNYFCAIYPLTYQQYRFLTGLDTVARSSYEEARLIPKGLSYSSLRGASTDDWPGWPAKGHAVKADSEIDKARQRYQIDFDLMTSAEWEYACRAGTTTSFNNGHNATNTEVCANADDIAWYKYNWSELGKKS